jgi:hypothetical protein
MAPSVMRGLVPRIHVLLAVPKAWMGGTSPTLRPQCGAPPGRCTVNTEPLPGSLVTVTSPPIMRASLRLMAGSSPVSPNFCAVVASVLQKSSSVRCGPAHRWEVQLADPRVIYFSFSRPSCCYAVSSRK